MFHAALCLVADQGQMREMQNLIRPATKPHCDVSKEGSDDETEAAKRGLGMPSATKLPMGNQTAPFPDDATYTFSMAKWPLRVRWQGSKERESPSSHPAADSYHPQSMSGPTEADLELTAMINAYGFE